MDSLNGGHIALVGSGASDDWRVIVGFAAVILGLTLLPLVVAKLTGALTAIPYRPPKTNGSGPRRWARRVPFIPSNW